jgi:5-methylcytosine-specific restriction endonuclease McrA
MNGCFWISFLRHMATRAEYAARPNRESLSKRLGKTAVLIKARDAHACVYCNRNAETSGAALHLDHLTPRSAGGADVPTNLVLACRRCNSARHDMDLDQWAAYACEKFGLMFTAPGIRAHACRALA